MKHHDMIMESLHVIVTVSLLGVDLNNHFFMSCVEGVMDIGFTLLKHNFHVIHTPLNYSFHMILKSFQQPGSILVLIVIVQTIFLV